MNRMNLYVSAELKYFPLLVLLPYQNQVSWFKIYCTLLDKPSKTGCWFLKQLTKANDSHSQECDTAKLHFSLKQWWVLRLNGHGLNFLLFQCFASSCNWQLLCGSPQAAWVLVFEPSKLFSNQSMSWQSKEANSWLAPIGPFWRNSKRISLWLVSLWAKLLIGSLFLRVLIGLFQKIPRQLVPDQLFWVKILLDVLSDEAAADNPMSCWQNISRKEN